MGRAAVSKLVVEDDGKVVFLGEAGWWKEVGAYESESAVQNDDGDAGVRRVAEALVVRLIRHAFVGKTDCPTVLHTGKRQFKIHCQRPCTSPSLVTPTPVSSGGQ